MRSQRTMVMAGFSLDLFEVLIGNGAHVHLDPVQNLALSFWLT